MNRVLLASLLAALSMSTPALAADPVATAVIQPGRSFPGGTLPSTGAWQALVCKVRDCEIRDVDVTVSGTSMPNILEEQEPVDVLGLPTFAEGEAAIAWFQGLNLPAGPVSTAHRHFRLEDSFEGKQVRALRRTGQWLFPQSDMKLSWVQTPDGYRRYHLASGGAKQFLFQVEREGHYGGDSTPMIHWAGDLDGDGRLDFLVDIPDDNCGYDERVYLTRNAGPGKIVRKAGQVAGREAACGC